jgi:hypothetical protein
MEDRMEDRIDATIPPAAEQIIKIATYIRQSTVPNKEEYFAEKFKTFKAKYPHLYSQLCTEENFDMNNLQFMLAMMQKVQNKEKDNYGADVVVGQMLYDKYLKEKLEKK